MGNGPLRREVECDLGPFTLLGMRGDFTKSYRSHGMEFAP